MLNCVGENTEQDKMQRQQRDCSKERGGVPPRANFSHWHVAPWSQRRTIRMNDDDSAYNNKETRNLQRAFNLTVLVYALTSKSLQKWMYS